MQLFHFYFNDSKDLIRRNRIVINIDGYKISIWNTHQKAHQMWPFLIHSFLCMPFNDRADNCVPRYPRVGKLDCIFSTHKFYIWRISAHAWPNVQQTEEKITVSFFHLQIRQPPKIVKIESVLHICTIGIQKWQRRVISIIYFSSAYCFRTAISFVPFFSVWISRLNF